MTSAPRSAHSCPTSGPADCQSSPWACAREPGTWPGRSRTTNESWRSLASPAITPMPLRSPSLRPRSIRRRSTEGARLRCAGERLATRNSSRRYYGTRRGAVDNYTNGFAVQSLACTTGFDAQEAAARISVPFLLVHSEHALAPPLARQFYSAVTALKSELWLESQGQIDFYDDMRLINPAADAIAEHFTSTLA